MGIDIYMRWENQTEEQKEAQYTGFSIFSGNVGYLREAYHGDPYVTKFLVQEAFDVTFSASDPDDKDYSVPIPAAVLRERLPEAIKLAIERAKKVYNEDIKETDESVQSFVHFVELAEKIEKETGKPVRILASW